MKYTVNVIGFTWGGYESSYTYDNFVTVPDALAIKQRAGDFQDVTDYQIVGSETSVTHDGPTTTITRKETIVRDWQDEESEYKFMEGDL